MEEFTCNLCIPSKQFSSKKSLQHHSRYIHNIYKRKNINTTQEVNSINHSLSKNYDDDIEIINNNVISSSFNNINPEITSNSNYNNTNIDNLTNNKSISTKKNQIMESLDEYLSLIFYNPQEQNNNGVRKYLNTLSFNCYKYHNVIDYDRLIKNEIIRLGYDDETLKESLNLLQSINSNIKKVLEEEKDKISNDVNQLPTNYQKIVNDSVITSYDNMTYSEYHNFIKMHKLIVKYGEHFTRKNHPKYITCKQLYNVINNFIKEREGNIIYTSIPIKSHKPPRKLRRIYYYIFYVCCIIFV
jgi:hypothetical protein